jgi:hypothetical protein
LRQQHSLHRIFVVRHEDERRLAAIAIRRIVVGAQCDVTAADDRR